MEDICYQEGTSYQENINYQEDIDCQNYQQDDDYLSDVFPLQEKKSFGGRKKSQVWDYFDMFGERKHGHVGCICKACNWKRAVGKASEMVDHLALSCPRISSEVKQFFLEEVRKRSALKLNHNPPNNNNGSAAKKSKTSQKNNVNI